MAGKDDKAPAAAAAVAGAPASSLAATLLAASNAKAVGLDDKSSALISAMAFGKDDKTNGKDSKDGGKDDKKEVKALVVENLSPLKMTSKDKKEYTVTQKEAFISVLVKTALENDDKAENVDVPGVTGAILELVVQYMKEHKGVEPPLIEKPLRSKIMKDVCSHKWDADYIDKIGDTRQQLYDLILAANYMDIKSLLHLGCAKVASLIKGQPLEKIKEILDPNQGGAKKDDKDAAKDNKDAKDVKTDEKDTKKSAATGSGAATGSTKNKPAAASASASSSASSSSSAAAATK